MTHKLFDGRAKAEEIERRLLNQTLRAREKVLHSIVVGDDEGALKYQKMKQAAAERVGAKLIIDHFDSNKSFEDLKSKIEDLGSDDSVDGIMIQLPLPVNLRHKTKDLIDLIDPKKDVDGMRPARLSAEAGAGGDDSPFIAPVVMAVDVALDDASKVLDKDLKTMKTLVVGSSGFVGQKLVRRLSDKNYIVVGVDEGDYLDPYTKSADVIVSVTGVENLIGPEKIKDGAILIDVGSPKGDIAKDAYDKAAFVSPVPGGIGPVTIACLLENLIIDK